MNHKKYIIITGANGYLSQYFSKHLIKKYNLILWDIKFDTKFKKNINNLAKKNSSDLFTMNIDITSRSNINKAVEIIKKNKIKIYSLINCAGLNPQPNIKNPDYYKDNKSFIKLWNKELDISLKGYMQSIYEISKVIPTSINGCIINFSSDLGIISPNQNIYSQQSIKPLVYSISKHGIIGMTKYFATLFTDKKIRVNSICFGGVYNEKFDKKFIKKISSLIPLGRMCKIEEIISPIEFLLDENNSYMNGHALVIDGGRSIW